ncbi:MAG: glycosyltransferase family 39 protein [Chloroflexi bacterium]|nr:glycosyltransferase family 39 protein [Chloroflexota bacterium]
MIRISSVLWLLVWLGLVFYLGLTLWLGMSGLVYAYQLDYGEGIVLWFAQQIYHGQPIYKSLTDFPFASSNYPPVAMLLSAALMPIFGEGYASGRLLNFVSMLIVAVLIYRIVQAETKNRNASVLAALFFLGSPYIYHWSPLDRVDLIGLAFTFGGVYFVWEYLRPPTTDRRPLLFLAFGVLCFLFALYTKQTLMAGPAAAFLALWMRNRRQAILFAVVLGAIGGALFLVINFLTAGGFYLGLIESNVSLFLVDQLVAQLITFATTFPILLLLALWSWIQRVRAKPIGVLEWYAVAAIAMLSLAGRIGAWENYFFEAIAILCTFLGYQFATWSVLRVLSLRNTQYATRITPLILPVLLLIQLALMNHDPWIAADLMARNYSSNQQLSPLLQRTQGTIISEDMGALATNGKSVDYYTYQYSMLARSAKWNQNWELNGLREGLFPLVILEHGTRENVDHYRRFTREFVSTLDRYYARTQTAGKYEIYTPAPPLKLQSANFGNVIALVGWNLEPATLQPVICNLTIVWQAKRGMDRRYKAFVLVERWDGDKVTQDDREPRYGNYPTTRWAANEMVRETYTLNISEDLSPGKYVLKVGWYDPETDDRLEVPGSQDNAFVLATYEVK